MNGLNERTKQRIALLAGDDLDDEEVAEVRRLIIACPDCRQHWVRVQGCLDVLDRGGALESEEVLKEPGLWPAISSRLRPSAASSHRRKFNGWVPALSMAAACIAMLAAGQLDATWQQEGSWPARSERMASGIQRSRWMPISQETLAPARAVPLPNSSDRSQFPGDDWGAVLVNSERIRFSVLNTRRDPLNNW